MARRGGCVSPLARIPVAPFAKLASNDFDFTGVKLSFSRSPIIAA
jgi:hypothetical protein